MNDFKTDLFFAPVAVHFKKGGGTGTPKDDGEWWKVDKKIKDKAELRGLVYTMSNAGYGDYIEVKLVDKDNLLGGGAGQVILTYLDRWGTLVGSVNDINNLGSLVIIDGMYLRFLYYASDLNGREGTINYTTYNFTGQGN